MKLQYYYKFRLANKAKRVYSYKKKSESYIKFENVKELRLKFRKRSGVLEEFELLKNDKSFALVTFVNSKYGLGTIPQSDDILLLKKSIDKLGLLQVLVFPSMKQYAGIAFQLFTDGHFDKQIRSLRSSLIQ